MTVFFIGDSESDVDQEQEDTNLIKANKSSASLDVSKDSKDAEHGHHDEPILQAIEKFCCLIIWPMQFIMPVKVLPELALALIFFIVYIMCEFILTVFNVFSVYTGLSHFLIGLTLMVWGSDNLEMINMAISMKNQNLELGLTSVLACQVICLILIIPIACLMRMYSREQFEIQVMQTHHNRDIIILPPLISSLLCMFIYWYRKMDLNRTTALILMLIYFIYLGFNVYMFYYEED